MDSGEINKIMGGVLAAFLVLLLLNFFSGKIYDTRPTHGHGPEQLAFAVEIEEATAGTDEPEEVDFAAIFGAADAAAGEKVFKKCAACHALEEGKNKSGPYLYRVVGRDIGSANGFGYSSGLQDAEGNWDPQKLYAFLENPKAFGSSMPANYKKSKDRANVIAYLNEAGGAPVPLE